MEEDDEATLEEEERKAREAAESGEGAAAAANEVHLIFLPCVFYLSFMSCILYIVLLFGSCDFSFMYFAHVLALVYCFIHISEICALGPSGPTWFM